eukprot:scaffold176380_cov28-Tisochrysis_lutea.AAC.3
MSVGRGLTRSPRLKPLTCEYAVRARPPSQVEVDHPTIDPRLDETDNELLPPCAATEQLEVPTRHAAIRLVAAVARGQYVRARGVQCRDERRTRIGQEHLGGVTQQHVQAAGHKRRCEHASRGQCDCAAQRLAHKRFVAKLRAVRAGGATRAGRPLAWRRGPNNDAPAAMCLSASARWMCRINLVRSHISVVAVPLTTALPRCPARKS